MHIEKKKIIPRYYCDSSCINRDIKHSGHSSLISCYTLNIFSEISSFRKLLQNIYVQMRTEKDCYRSDNVTCFSTRNLLTFSCISRTTKFKSIPRAKNMLQKTHKRKSPRPRSWVALFQSPISSCYISPHLWLDHLFMLSLSGLQSYLTNLQ